jgi:hypothetical protein
MTQRTQEVFASGINRRVFFALRRGLHYLDDPTAHIVSVCRPRLLSARTLVSFGVVVRGSSKVGKRREARATGAA